MAAQKKYELTERALERIMKGDEIDQPIMQILGCKKIQGNSEKERYRVLLSDGVFFITYAMLTTHINESLPDGGIETNMVVRLKKYVTSLLTNQGKAKRVLVIMDLEVIAPASKVGGKIGDPKQLQEDDLSGSSTAKQEKENNVPKTFESPAKRIKIDNRQNNSPNQTYLHSDLTYPIASLSPYQNRWVIKARVTNKSNIRTWANSRGEGKLFSMDLMDESGEIRATAFKEMADKFFDMIEVDKVYYFSKCQLKPANAQFCTVKNDYEMTFTNDTIVQECLDEASGIPQIKYSFLNLENIAKLDAGSFVDVIGVAKSATDIMTFQAKTTGRELKKREIMLVDKSNTAIALTLWGDDAEKFDASNQPVIALKGAKMGEFGGGKNLSCMQSTTMKINPDIPEAHQLRGWFDNGGGDSEAVNISARNGGMNSFQTPWLSFAEVASQGLGHEEKGGYYQNMGTILLTRSENCIYKACPLPECNKKVDESQNGMYECPKCKRQFPNFKYRLLAKANIGDWSGNQWVSMFASEAEKIFGMTSDEVGKEMENDSEAIVKITSKANFKQFIFKFRVKTEMYNDEAQLKTVVMKVDPVDYTEYNSHLISRIEELSSKLS